MEFEVSDHAVERYLLRFLREHPPYTSALKGQAKVMLEELVGCRGKICRTDYVRPIPYVTTEVWAGRDWSGLKIFLFIDGGEVVNVLTDEGYTQRYRMVDGQRTLIGKGCRGRVNGLRIPTRVSTNSHGGGRGVRRRRRS